MAEPVRSLTLRLLKAGGVTLKVRPAGRFSERLSGDSSLTTEAAKSVNTAGSFAWFLTMLPPKPGPVHEWTARAAAGALAAESDLPVIDTATNMIKTADHLLGTLPGAESLAGTPGGFRLADWLATPWAEGTITTRGMSRFGLPELTVSDVPAQEAFVWAFGLYGIGNRLYSLLRAELRRGSQPAFLAVPADQFVSPAGIGTACGMPVGTGRGLPVQLSLDITTDLTAQVRVDTPDDWPGGTEAHRKALRALLVNSAMATLSPGH